MPPCCQVGHVLGFLPSSLSSANIHHPSRLNSRITSSWKSSLTILLNPQKDLGTHQVQTSIMDGNCRDSHLLWPLDYKQLGCKDCFCLCYRIRWWMDGWINNWRKEQLKALSLMHCLFSRKFLLETHDLFPVPWCRSSSLGTFLAYFQPFIQQIFPNYLFISSSLQGAEYEDE